MKLTVELERGVAALYSAGFGMIAIAANLGISVGAVHRALREAGISSRPVGRPRRRKSSAEKNPSAEK